MGGRAHCGQRTYPEVRKTSIVIFLFASRGRYVNDDLIIFCVIGRVNDFESKVTVKICSVFFGLWHRRSHVALFFK